MRRPTTQHKHIQYIALKDLQYDIMAARVLHLAVCNLVLASGDPYKIAPKYTPRYPTQFFFRKWLVVGTHTHTKHHSLVHTPRLGFKLAD